MTPVATVTTEDGRGRTRVRERGVSERGREKGEMARRPGGVDVAVGEGEGSRRRPYPLRGACSGVASEVVRR